MLADGRDGPQAMRPDDLIDKQHMIVTESSQVDSFAGGLGQLRDIGAHIVGNVETTCRSQRLDLRPQTKSAAIWRGDYQTLRLQGIDNTLNRGPREIDPGSDLPKTKTTIGILENTEDRGRAGYHLDPALGGVQP